MFKTSVLAAVAALCLAGVAQAKVVDAQANGFQVQQSAVIAASPDTVWKAMVDPAKWWSSDHTFTGDAKNIVLEAQVRGCFCEKSGEQGAATMRVSFVDPGKELDLWGAIGPLSRFGVAGGWTMVLTPEGAGTKVTWTYTAGGYVPGGADKLAAPVDGVFGQQIGRLKAFVETGKPG